MGLPKVRKKPTNREMAGVIIEMNSKLENVYRYIGQLDNILGLYIEMNKHSEKFNKFIELKQKELNEKNDKKTNGKTDKEDISSDSGNKGARPKRVRKKSK